MRNMLIVCLIGLFSVSCGSGDVDKIPTGPQGVPGVDGEDGVVDYTRVENLEQQVVELFSRISELENKKHNHGKN